MSIGSVSPKQDQRVLLNRHERAGAEWRVRGLARRRLDRPARAEAARGQREDHRLRVRIEEEEERVAGDRLAVRRTLADLAAVEEDAERPRLGIRPLALSHPAAVRPEPPRVG